MKGEHKFIDTNILVYAHDTSAGRKYDEAKDLVRELWNGPYPPAVSTQVLQELYVNLTRKKIAPEVATKLVESYYAWEVIAVDQAALSSAFGIHTGYKISFWDALIVAAAKRAGADSIISEDLNAGQRYEGMLVRNPFK